MRLLLAIAVGGAIGSVARWLASGWVQARSAHASGALALLPIGTLAVNLIGCFAIGFLATAFQERLAATPEVRGFVLVGLLGGLTTFSTFGFETFALARDGNFALAASNVLGGVACGLVGVWLGVVLARFW